MIPMVKEDCPINVTTRRYGLDLGSVLHIVRMNWRMSVLSVVTAAGEKGLHYSEIQNMCGLNPRTLSIVLKELISKKLIEKMDRFPEGGAIYVPTKAGDSLARSDCPLLQVATRERPPSRR